MTGYPWQHGDTLKASDLNTAIANAGTPPVVPQQGTVNASTPTTVITPTGLSSVVVNLTASTTITINSGYAGQTIRLELRQDATGGRIVTLGAGIAFGTDAPSFTASTAPSKRDLLQFINSGGGTSWMLVAVSHGFGV